MKKFLLSAIALTIVATPAFAQDRDDHRDRDQRPQYGQTVQDDRHDDRRQQSRANYRQWRKGERFDYRQARDYRVVNDYRAYRLAPPPRGYHYVRSGNDVVLVAVTTGIIAGIIAGAIH
jgi:Ni/Co efflux regulator RcnB